MKRAAAILGFVAVLAAAPSAYADAIDGDWCSAKGLSLSIDGPKIRIPSGASLEGRYGRHQFAYQVPAGEDHGGEMVYLELISEEMMLFRWIKDGTASEPDLWKRCNVTS